ncbi:G-protein coupled receptor family C group 6 member A [Monodelphis domestica]|uniref:G-protein coupled receptor family C group 6 member A n=1 Tax=Monodelphis domestica TaxID=13616 RepID=UPI0024E1DF2F|nr:G-protein coupled receptor family C group 6 member A [Monodelphis domestica]
MTLLRILFPYFVTIFNLSQPCQIPDDFVAASSPGHIVIGGLFAVHNKMIHSEEYPTRPEIQTCEGFEISIFLQALAMIHSIEIINNSSLLPGVKLGYEIYDTCTEVTIAIAATLRFLSKFNCTQDIVEFHCNYSNYTPRVKAVIGTSYSEITIAVSRMLNLQLIPQVSHASTAEILSDKIRFPSFFRTAPSDFYQTKAMAHLIQKSGWNWIGIITTDDDYGRLALGTFGMQASANNVCIAFREILPAFLSDSTIEVKINQTLEKIMEESHVNVIVVFLRQFHVFDLFNKAIQRNINKVWIASDTWSAAVKISTIPNVKRIGKVVGFAFKSGNMSSFHDFLQNIHLLSNEKNKLLSEYIMLLSSCSHVKDSDLNYCIANHSQGNWAYKIVESNFSLRNNFLLDNAEPGPVHSLQLAISALAYAIRDQCRDRNCQNPTAFHPWELLEALKNVTFTDGKNEFQFDSQGDINTGYDVLLWKEVDGRMTIITMAEYDLEKDDFIFKDNGTEKEFRNLKKIQSKCSRECTPGQMKKTTQSPHTCCYECVSCPENYYTNQTDMDYCLLCDNKTHWAPVNSTVCFEKEVEYLNWNDWFAIMLLTLSTLGIICTFAVGIIFTRNLNTPVVKSSGGLIICYVILLCHFFNFVSTSLFVGEPQDFKCKTRQTLFGMSFALCISCILTKSLKILLAFSFEPRLQKCLKRLYKPIPIIVICTGIQMIICTIWLLFAAPFVEENFSIPRVIILECDEGSIMALGTMLSYIAILAFICFISAFKGRKLPANYNEAKFITFGMLIYFISWIIFIPVYATTFGKYLPAVEIIVILISNYGILCCTFFPKCYIILCKQETNTKSAFLKTLYTYSSQSACSLNVSHISLDSGPSEDSLPNQNFHCKTPGTSEQGKVSQAQMAKHVQSPRKRTAKNMIGILPRKRTSSI